MVAISVFNGPVELKGDEREALRALVNNSESRASVATRARIVLWRAEGRQKKEIAALAGVSRPTVDLCLARHVAEGIAGLLGSASRRGAGPVSAAIRARILAVGFQKSGLGSAGRSI